MDRNFNRINRLFNDLFSKSFVSDFESMMNLNDNFHKKTFNSNDGLYRFTIMTNGGFENEIDETHNLKQKLELAVESQDFESAVKLRDQINKLEKNKEEIRELELELENCVKTQNFERAIEVRDQIKSLK